jgi:molecular chaperone GrpE (heat shock protein)
MLGLQNDQQATAKNGGKNDLMSTNDPIEAPSAGTPELSTAQDRPSDEQMAPTTELRQPDMPQLNYDSLVAPLKEFIELSAARLESRISEIATLIRSASASQQTIASLVDENQVFKSVANDKILEPILRDLMSLATDLGHLHSNSGLEPIATARSLVEDILERYGLAALGAEQGDKFDPALHQSIGRDITTERDLDGLISEVVSGGYKSAVRVLLFPKVKVFRYSA